jgi:ABC-type transport system involved in cytochrome c biogenesis ATPase subunit
VAYSKFKDGDGREYLPKNVFGYYSGPSNRLEKHFEKHQDKFYRQLINPEKYGIDDNKLPLRPLFYARMIHSHFVLLAFFLDDDPTIISFLKDQLGIKGLDSVLFVMRNPKSWNWKNRKGGDKRFWHAKGIVQKFLDRLYGASLAPHRVTISRTEEFLYLFIKDKEALKKLALNLSNADFFKELESTYISDIIEEIRIRVELKGMNETLTFRELSEGEQQLLTVLGLIRFTSESESLFLLDEPDTHLNPAWGMNYIEFLASITDLEKNNKKQLSSQIILATHDPIVLAPLYKEQVQVMKRDESNMTVFTDIPEYDPIGMGYTGILTSDMFGFRSDLDQLTLSYLDERAILAGKDKLSPRQLDRLEELNQKLDESGFLEAYSDPYFSAFVKAWARRNKVDKFKKPFLNDQDRKELEQMTDEILDELKSEDKIKK